MNREEAVLQLLGRGEMTLRELMGALGLTENRTREVLSTLLDAGEIRQEHRGRPGVNGGRSPALYWRSKGPYVLQFPAGERRSQVITVLRNGPATVRQIASVLGMSKSRVDDLIYDMERDGEVVKAGRSPTPGRWATLWSVA